MPLLGERGEAIRVRAVRVMRRTLGDRRVLRLIGKWLKAGVLEDGTWAPSEEGTPQGAVISPLLANVYLHYVYDLWVERWRRREARGEMIVVRYTDDTIVGFEDHACAEQFARDLTERLDRFTKPVAGTVRIYLDGVEQLSG